LTVELTPREGAAFAVGLGSFALLVGGLMLANDSVRDAEPPREPSEFFGCFVADNVGAMRINRAGLIIVGGDGRYLSVEDRSDAETSSIAAPVSVIIEADRSRIKFDAHPRFVIRGINIVAGRRYPAVADGHAEELALFSLEQSRDVIFRRSSPHRCD
jgi:hypothetical protein